MVSSARNQIFSRDLLRLSAECYRSILESSLDAILLTTLDGRIAFANSAACEMFRRTEEDILKMGRDSFVDSSDPRLKSALAQRLSTGKFRGELTLVRGNGEKFEAELSSAVFTAEDGQVYSSMVIRDVTPQKTVEAARRKSEEQYRSLFEDSLIGISYSHPDGRLLRINPAYARIYGYPSVEVMLEEVKNIQYQCYANPTDRNAVLRILDEKGLLEPREIEIIRRDGSHTFVLVSVCEVRDDQGVLQGYQATHFDLSDMKKVENIVKNRNLMFRTLVNSAPIGVAVVGRNHKISEVNRTLVEILHVESEDLKAGIYEKWKFLRSDGTEVQLNEIRKKFLASENLTDSEVDLGVVRDDGDTVWLSVNFTKLDLPDTTAMIIAKDITIRKKTEDELRKMRKDLDSKNRLLDQKNVALREIIGQISFEKELVEKRIVKNLKTIIFPLLKKLALIQNDEGLSYFKVLESSLLLLTSSFGGKISEDTLSLSLREIEICNLIKNGLSTKEISRLLGLSIRGVECHRNNIRRKLNLKNKKVNLANYLNSMV